MDQQQHPTGGHSLPAHDHLLKIGVPFFDAVASGIKPFEVRRNDRGYQTGDVLLLCEWDRARIAQDDVLSHDGVRCLTGRAHQMRALASAGCPWTGRRVRVEVSWLHTNSPNLIGLAPGYVVLGLRTAGDR